MVPTKGQQYFDEIKTRSRGGTSAVNHLRIERVQNFLYLEGALAIYTQDVQQSPFRENGTPDSIPALVFAKLNQGFQFGHEVLLSLQFLKLVYSQSSCQ